ncbi:unnamed protein product, partial [Didymodactylos carnosus]
VENGKLVEQLYIENLMKTIDTKATDDKLVLSVNNELMVLELKKARLLENNNDETIGKNLCEMIKPDDWLCADPDDQQWTISEV